MKDELVTILEEILKDFAKTNQPEQVQSSLQLFGVLTATECATINASILPDDQFLEIFKLLKSKPNEVFKNLQQICIKLKWRRLFSLIKNKLKNIQREDLVISYTEQLEHHDAFTYGFRYPISHFTGREEHLKNINDFFQQSDIVKSANQTTASAQSSNRILLISGLGGVGKTQLAVTYINKHRLDFDSIVWINAESESALIASFYGLASVLDIVTEEKSGIKPLSYKIFQELLKKGIKHLAIFDNADQLVKETMEEILSDLPYKIHVLITSRQQSWPNSRVINVDVFTEEEAKSFILKSINIAEGKTDDKALKLAQTLDYFPLALQQATAYIKNMKDYTIQDYTTEYEANEKSIKKLLSFQLQEHNQDENIATTFATWKITFNKIKNFKYKLNTCQTEESVKESLLFKTFTTVKMIFDKIKDKICKEKDTLPLKIFNIMAYLASDNIPTTLFLDVISGEKMQLIWAIKVLEDFSLVSVNSCLLKVHNMVQLVTQLQLAEENRSMEFISAAIQLLVKNFPSGDDSYPAIGKKRVLLSHLAAVKFHTEKAGKENLFNKSSHIEFHYPILAGMTETYWNIGEVNSSRKICEELLQIQEKHYGPDHFTLAATLLGLSNAHIQLGDPQTAKALLERGLAIEKRHYGSDHFQLAVTLTNLAAAHNDLGDPQTAKTLLERALLLQERHYGPDHFKLATILSNLSNVHRQLGDPQTAKTLLTRALEIQERRYGSDHFQTAMILSNLSNVHSDLGDPQTAQILLERALVIQEYYYGPDHFQLATTLLNLSNTHRQLGNPQTAKILLTRALEIQERHYGPDHFQLAMTLSHLSAVYRDLGDLQSEKTLLEKVLVIQEHHYGPDHYEVAATLSNLSNAYNDIGDPQTAKSLLERALVIQEYHYGPDHFQLVMTLSNLSNAHSGLGNFQNAKSLLERALVIQERHYGSDHFQLATILINLSNAYRQLGDLQTAKILLKRTLEIQERHYGPDHFELALTLLHLSAAHRDLNDFKNAKSLLERALVIQEHHYGPDHFQLAVTLSHLSATHRDLNDPQSAKCFQERALMIQERHYGPNHIQVALTLSNLSNAHSDLGDHHSAKTLLERALEIQEHHYGPDHLQLVDTLLKLSLVHGALGDPKTQKILSERALKINEIHYGSNHLETLVPAGFSRDFLNGLFEEMSVAINQILQDETKCRDQIDFDLD